MEIGYNEFNEWASRAGNALGESAKQARVAACTIYRDYPAFSTGSIPFTTPLGNFVKGVWDNLCSDQPPGLPAPPRRPVEGGQCGCVAYKLVYEITSPGQTPVLSYRNDEVWGKIGGVINIDTGVQQEYYVLCQGRVGTHPCGAYRQVGIASYSRNSTMRIISCVRSDGQADTCGNLPTDWEPPQKLTPPANIINQSFTINNVSPVFVVPVLFAPINGQFSIPVNVGGIKLNFGIKGIDFNFKQDNGSIINYPPPMGETCQVDLAPITSIVNDTRNKVVELGGDLAAVDEITRITKDNLGDVKKGVDKVVKPDINPLNYEKTIKSPTDPKKEDNIPNIQYVLITLTKKPILRKSQSGEGSPDVYYAGWFEWLVNGVSLPRLPIHFEQSLFESPQNAYGYAYTLTNSAEGFATVLIKKES